MIMVKNAPACTWNPPSLQLDRQIQPLRRRLAKWGERAEPMTVHGRDNAEVVDSLRMNLRQAKQALTMRDEEIRRLRSSVVHLEGALSTRERELRETVHRLQREVAAKQDHIEHLKRQASLGFLREAKEQAEEYRLEAERLAHTLAATTESARDPLWRSTGLIASKSPPSMVDDAGIPLPSEDEQEERPLRKRNRGRATSAHGLQAREAPPLSQLVKRSNEENVESSNTQHTPQRPSESRGGGCPPTSGEGREGVRPMQPSLAWESTVGAIIQSSSGRFRPAARTRHEPRDMRLAPRVSSVSSAFGGRSMELLHARSDDADKAALDLTRHAERADLEIRRSGRSSTRVGHRRWDRSIDRSHASQQMRRLHCMAASARLRSSVRQSAAERNEILALREESRRLQATRTERARRVRLTRQKIARYREERIRELESRLERRSGIKAPDVDQTTEKPPPEDPRRDDRGNFGEGVQAIATSAEHHTIGNNNSSSGNIGGSNIKLEQLSRLKQEIDAAIAAVTQDTCTAEESRGYDRHKADNEPAKSFTRGQAEGQDHGSQGKQPRGGQPSGRQRQSLGADSRSSQTTYKLPMHGNDDSLYAIPTGKPPLAPSRSSGRPRHFAGARRRSSVSEVDEVQRGDHSGSSKWQVGDVSGSVADEVQSEGTGFGSDDSVGNLSDIQESVWEESFPDGGWGRDGERSPPEEGIPSSALIKEEREAAIFNSPGSHNALHGRQHHRVKQRTQGSDHTGAAYSREHGGGQMLVPDTHIIALDTRHEGVHSDGGRCAARMRYQRPRHGNPSSLSEADDFESAPNNVGIQIRNPNGNLSRHRRDVVGCGMQQEHVLADGPNSQADVGTNDTRQRHLRELGIRRKELVDEGCRRGSGERRKHGNHGSFESPVASRARELREENPTTVDDTPDDDGSYGSRWSLSEEDESLEKRNPEKGSTPEASHGEDGGGRDKRLEEKEASASRTGQERSDGGNSSAVSERADSVKSVNAGAVPEDIDDDFAHNPEVRYQRSWVSDDLGRSSNSGIESFATTAKGVPTNRELGAAQPFFGGPERERDGAHAEADTDTNDWLINDPPMTVRSTSWRSRDSRASACPCRPLSARHHNHEEVPPQPALPSALNASPDETAEGRVSDVEGDQSGEGDQEHESRQSSDRQETSITTNVAPGGSGLACDKNGGHRTDLLEQDPGHCGHSEGQNYPEDQDIDHGTVSTASLFKSLSSTTADATLSSKSAARVTSKNGDTRGSVEGSRDGKVSSTTLGLSPTTSAESVGKDYAGMSPGDKTNTLELPSSDVLKSKHPPQIGPTLVVGESDAAVGDNAAIQISTLGKDMESPTSSSLSLLPASSSFEVDEVKKNGRPCNSSRNERPIGNVSKPPMDKTESDPESSLCTTTVRSAPEESAHNSPRQSPAASLGGEEALSHHELPSDSETQTAAKPAIHHSESSALDETAARPSPPTPEGEPTVQPDETAGNEADRQSEGDRVESSCFQQEEPTLDELNGSVFAYPGETESLDGLEVGDVDRDEAANDREGSDDALEERSLVEERSSHSTSLLDVGERVDGGNDDDDGYF